MRFQRIPRPPRRWQPRGYHPDELRAPRLVLLQRVAEPPRGGDRLESLVARLGMAPGEVEAAVRVLVEARLARRRRDVIRASPAALLYERLWPTAL
jgi:hypothetical protein